MAADDLALLCLFMSFSWHVFEHYSKVGKEITKIMEACHSLILQQYSHFQLWSVPSIQSLLDLELVGELTACIVDQLISWLSTTVGLAAAERWILSCRAWLICPCILISSLTHAGTVIATWVGITARLKRSVHAYPGSPLNDRLIFWWNNRSVPNSFWLQAN